MARARTRSAASGNREALQETLLAWYRRHGRELPWRQTRNPYYILVAEVMLQQTQVERVLPKYAEWLAAFPTLVSLAEAPTAEVIRRWSPLGYNSRAVRLQHIARACAGTLPDTFEGLLELKGIGRYTAGAVACFAYEQQVAFWDTNIRRALSRLLSGAASDLSEKALLELASNAVPPGEAYDWHQALMDLGATVCTSRLPRCGACPLTTHCAAYPQIQSAGALTRLAERRASYDAGRPFETTNRYFRGRIVEALRERSPRTTTEICEVIGRSEQPWLEGVLAGLERDGLIARHAGSVSLP
ncbi:MAG: A/G-specific adenine glycosylase [Chloroflexi bacterium]|nr:A/G-specific adenine glycosylase [Chloroflexota bacterium]